MFGRPSQTRADAENAASHRNVKDEQDPDFGINVRQFQLPEKFFDKVLEIERQIDEMKENTPHDLLQTLMSLYSDAIEYYGANDDHEMCIDLNMRMQSVLVRPYILDCLCEHNQLTTSQTENFKGQLYGAAQNESLPEEDSVEVEFDVKTNFESDKRRKSNPFKKIFKKKKGQEEKEEAPVQQKQETKSQQDSEQIDSATTAPQTTEAPSPSPALDQNKSNPKKQVGIIPQSNSPGVRPLNNGIQKKFTQNEHLINAMMKRSKKSKEDVIKDLQQNFNQMSDGSDDDEIDMSIFDDKPKDKEEKDGNKKEVPAYKGIHDTHDYGHSDNEEKFVVRSKGKKSKHATEKSTFYDSDYNTDDLTKEHTQRKQKRTRVKQNIRYAHNAKVIQIRFKIVEMELIVGKDNEEVDDSITFNRTTKDSNNYKKLQNSKAKAQNIIKSYIQEHKFEIQEKVKQRQIARMKKQTSRKFNPNLTATAGLLNKVDTSNIMENPADYDDNDEFDYVQVDDDNLNDVSQSDIMALTQAMGAQAKEGKPVYERKPTRKSGYANSVLTNNQLTTGMAGQPLTHSPIKNLKTGTISDQQSQLQAISPLQIGKTVPLKKNTSAHNMVPDSGKESGEGAQANGGSGSFLQSKSGSSNFNILRVQNCDEIDNPDEMNKIENQEGEFSEDDDPEQLDEMERRKEEIEENFTERSMQMKHDMIEKVTKEIEEEFDSEHEDEMDEKLTQEIKKINKEMDKKRQESKLVLRKKLNEIIQDQEQTIEVRLQKLYDEAEINKFIDSLLK